MTFRSLIRLAGIGKSYGAVTVLQPFDLEIGDGEFLTILGPSGSGKTTILRMLGGFTAPSTGRILLDGTDITDTPIFRRPFNTVFQDYALFPHMTVARNVGYGLRMRRRPRAEVEKRVAEALAVVGLADKAGRHPGELSGGQRQRVALARAIICEPRVVLLDEPLAALDAGLRRSMQEFLKDLQRRIRTTFVFITHDQEEAIAMSDRIVVMDHGRVEQVGTPRRSTTARAASSWPASSARTTCCPPAPPASPRSTARWAGTPSRRPAARPPSPSGRKALACGRARSGDRPRARWRA